MSRKRAFVTTILTLLLLSTAGAAAAAEPIADFSVDSSGISFSMKSAAETTLVVSGPGKFHLQQTFDAGSAPSLSAFDEAGNFLAPGLYTYTLTANRVAEGKRLDNGSLEQAMVQTGSFTILESGGLANPNLIENFDKAQVIVTDLVVQGSICAGFDCVNGESFGFDTIRMKENNLRIHAQDTSNSASFPTVDWRLVFNDTGNGGANFFAVEDSDTGRRSFIVEGGAPANTLYAEADGDVGIKTANPVVDLHIVEGNTPTVRLEQDGSDGFTPQTWDLAGNEANFFIRDVTNGSKLSFRIFPNAPESSLVIEQNTGDIGLGTTSPDAELDVEADTPEIRMTGTTSGGIAKLFVSGNGRLNITDDATNARLPIKVHPGGNSNLLRVGSDINGTNAANTVAIGASGGGDAILDVQGSIRVNSMTLTVPDYVFESNYDLLSIKDQGTFMRQNKHLPSLPKAPEGLKGPIDLLSHQFGILEELEKAHLYIEQLHGTVEGLQGTIQGLQGRLEQLEEKSAE